VVSSCGTLKVAAAVRGGLPSLKGEDGGENIRLEAVTSLAYGLATVADSLHLVGYRAATATATIPTT